MQLIWNVLVTSRTYIFLPGYYFIESEISRNKFYELILDCTAHSYQLLIVKGEVALAKHSGIS